jgi:hypothetical protein
MRSGTQRGVTAAARPRPTALASPASRPAPPSAVLRILTLFATTTTLLITPVTAPDADAATFGFNSVSLTSTNADSSAATQAGSHPDALNLSLAYETETHPTLGEIPSGQPRDLRIQLPPGLLGQARARPFCPLADFANFVGTEVPVPDCPDSSAIGFATVDAALPERGSAGMSVFNLAPLPGELARFGFGARSFSFAFSLRLSQTYPYRLLVESRSISQQVGLLAATIIIWGDPSAAAHEAQRGRCGAYLEREGVRFEAEPGSTCPTQPDEVPFLTLPRSCIPASASFEADPWGEPGAWVSAVVPDPLTPTDCGKLGFSPTLAATPTTTAARAPSGLDLTLELPNPGLASATGTANADLAAATLTLPPQMTVNPAIAAGLSACSPAQLAAETPTSAPGEGCPQAAKIGTATVTTPLLTKPLAGTIFLATPDDPTTNAAGAENPLDARYALYLLLRDSYRGVLISVPIRLDPDPASGRLSAKIPTLPQLPFTHFELRFNAGPRAPLTTPPCGNHAATAGLTPSSGAPPSPASTAFATAGECAAPGFAPTLKAGTSSNAAASSAPFLLDLAAAPGEPGPAAIELTLPPGLSADFAGVAECPESATATATCPPDSRVGHARLALGLGPAPLWIPEAGKDPSGVYLAGPHEGAPYSLLIAIPAQAGPFDLGTVVLRAPIRIDPLTAQASVRLDGLPRILAGVPLHYRTLRLVLDRPGFIRNPTSCEATRIAGTATSTDGMVAPLSSRFQAADCAALRFKPRLALRLSGGLARNGHPSLRAVLRPRRGQASIRDAAFTLPAGQLLDLHRLRALCPRRLSPERCPRASRLGRVRLLSPHLDGRLAGPIYLREPTRGLPDLIADLHSGPLRILLRGYTAAPRNRLRIRLRALPDVPLNRAVITLAGGRRGILVNSESLCGTRRRARGTLSAHNGKRRLFRPKLRLSCHRRTANRARHYRLRR